MRIEIETDAQGVTTLTVDGETAIFTDADAEVARVFAFHAAAGALAESDAGDSADMKS